MLLYHCINYPGQSYIILKKLIHLIHHYYHAQDRFCSWLHQSTFVVDVAANLLNRITIRIRPHRVTVTKFSMEPTRVREICAIVRLSLLKIVRSVGSKSTMTLNKLCNNNDKCLRSVRTKCATALHTYMISYE